MTGSAISSTAALTASMMPLHVDSYMNGRTFASLLPSFLSSTTRPLLTCPNRLLPMRWLSFSLPVRS